MLSAVAAGAEGAAAAVLGLVKWLLVRGKDGSPFSVRTCSVHCPDWLPWHWGLKEGGGGLGSVTGQSWEMVHVVQDGHGAAPEGSQMSEFEGT